MNEREKMYKKALSYLEHTAWARGVYTQRLQVPGARPAQLRAGARKIVDRYFARKRKQAAQT